MAFSLAPGPQIADLWMDTSYTRLTGNHKDLRSGPVVSLQKTVVTAQLTNRSRVSPSFH